MTLNTPTLKTLLAGLFVVTASGAAHAAIFAIGYSDYMPGSLSPADYDNPATALGKPNPITGGLILSPFSATWSTDEMVGIGPGGSLTLQFSSPVTVGAGLEFGVHTGVNLWERGGTGTNLDPAGTLNVRRAVVEVGDTAGHFVALNGGAAITFNIPTNYYADLAGPPGTATTPGSIEADFGKPFAGTIATFNGLDWTETKAALDGSAGGTWLDASGSGLEKLNFVRFSVPTDANYRMFIDAVAGASAVPEPTSLGVVIVGGLLLARRRR
jgi:hypothetical protein